jgi:Mg-chelatase subunit ChlD
MAIKTNLSDRWRVNKSLSKHIELANTLRAMRKIFGYLDFGVKVVWSGMSTNKEFNLIELPPSLVSGKYPIPGDNMDILIGYGIHESMHIVENSRYVRDYHYRKHNDQQEQNLVLQLVEICEDIHIDGVARKKGMLGNYVQKYRQWWNDYDTSELSKALPSLEQVLEGFLDIILDISYPNTSHLDLEPLKQIKKTDEINTNKLADILCAGDKTLKFAFHHVFVDILPECEKPLKAMLLNTYDIIENNPRDRALLYDDIWSTWGHLFIKWRNDIIAFEGALDKDTSDTPITYSQAAFLPDGGLSPELAAEVNKNLADNEDDYNTLLESSLGSVGGENLKWALFPTDYKVSDIPCKTPPDIQLAQTLKDIFTLQQNEAKKISRGLDSGKIDKRKLYRIATTELIFKEKEYDKQASWDITILVDASSSMAPSWELIESIFATLVKAWQSHKNTLNLYAYAEKKGTSVITNLLHNNKLFTIVPSGNTPSGQAIISTAMLIPKGNRRMLLHITDGKINVGVDIDFAIKFCEKERIDLLTIGTGMLDIIELHKRYGDDRFQIINTLNELPDVLTYLFRKKLLGKR